MNHIFMNPRDYENLQRYMDTPTVKRTRKADGILSRLGYTQIGQYDICHKMPSLPVLMLHGVRFVRPHYYAIVSVMTNVLNHYKQQDAPLPLPNLDHLRLAEFLFHAPRAWWKTLDEHRAHILMCVEAGSGPLVPADPYPGGRSTTFRQASGVTYHSSPTVARNTTYAMHSIQQTGIAQAVQAAGSRLGGYGQITANSPVAPPTTPFAGQWTAPPSPVTRTYETPLFTWLLHFTAPIRSLLLSNAASY